MLRERGRIFTAGPVALSLIAALLISAAPLGALAQQAPAPTQPPLPKSLDEALVTMVVGDLTGFLEDLDALAAARGEDAPATTIRDAIASGMFGEAGLSGFGKGRGVVTLVFPGTPPVSIAELPADAFEPYRKHFSAKNAACAQLEGGLAAFCASPRGIDIARNLKAEAATVLMMNSRSDLEIRLAPHRAVETFRPMVDMMLAGIARNIAAAQQQGLQGDQAPPAAAVRVIEGEIRTVLAVADQTDRVVIKAVPSAEAMSLELEMAPLADTALAALVNAPCPEAKTSMLGLFGSEGAVRGVAAMNPDAIAVFAEALLQRVTGEMGVGMEDVQALRKLMIEPLKSYGDQMAANMFTRGGEGLISGHVVMKTRSSEALLDAADYNIRQITEGGLSKFYEEMGIRIEGGLTRNARSYGGVGVHRVEVTQHFENLPAEKAEAMSEMMGNLGYEMAFVDDAALFGMGKTSVDPLIDAVRKQGVDGAALPAGDRLEALAVLPEGGNSYFDVYPFVFASRVLEPVLSAGSPAPQVADQISAFLDRLEGVPAVSAASYAGAGRMSARFHVPGEMVRRMLEATKPESKATTP